MQVPPREVSLAPGWGFVAEIPSRKFGCITEKSAWQRGTKDITVFIGDINVKIGADNIGIDERE